MLCSVWIIQDRIDDLENAKRHDKKKYKYFYCVKDTNYLVVKVSCVGKDIVQLIQVKLMGNTVQTCISYQNILYQ